MRPLSFAGTLLLAAIAASAAIAGEDSAADLQRVRIVGGSYFFKPNQVTVKAGRPVELTLSKESGLAPHNFVLESPQKTRLVDEPLTTEPARVTLKPLAPGKYAYYCTQKLLFMPSHRAQGMEGVLEVTE